ncbi:MAG: hypothetical protein J2P46_01365, partial [Zavarzinella sp.]|nr:hypothetical protein [Zavarzinella sp.]
FELSRCDGVQRYGWSAGYSHVCQRRNEPARVEDDYYSLGATLFHAVTGIDPIVMDQDPEANVAQTLSCLTAVCGAGAPVVGLVRDLLDADPAVRSSAARRLRTTTVLGLGGPAVGSPPDLSLAPILRHTLGVVLGHAEAILAEDVRKHVLPPPVTAYDGLAGLVMELARHPEALTAASQLARLTAFVVKRVEVPPALLYGRTGVSLALQAVASAGGDPALQGIAESILPGEEEIANERRVDVTHGLAGLGLGFLEFAASAPDPEPFLRLADRCAERLLFGEDLIEGNLRALPVGDPAHGISVADGFAHGRAGIAYFLLAHAAQTGYPKSRQRARRMMDQLADLVPDLAGRARSRLARPMAASWCQGLAGIGTALVRGARFFADDRLLTAARTAAAGCRSVAPRVPLVTQCCGLAGIGEFLLDLAIASGDTSHRQDAIEVLHLMLTRSGGPRTAPSFPDATMAATTPCWATGASGVLSFLRRLADPSSPRLWMADGIASGWPR